MQALVGLLGVGGECSILSPNFSSCFSIVFGPQLIYPVSQQPEKEKVKLPTSVLETTSPSNPLGLNNPPSWITLLNSCALEGGLSWTPGPGAVTTLLRISCLTLQSPLISWGFSFSSTKSLQNFPVQKWFCDTIMLKGKAFLWTFRTVFDYYSQSII